MAAALGAAQRFRLTLRHELGENGFVTEGGGAASKQAKRKRGPLLGSPSHRIVLDLPLPRPVENLQDQQLAKA